MFPLITQDNGHYRSLWPKTSKEPCPKCGKGKVVLRVHSTKGTCFLGCTNFPECRWTQGQRWVPDWVGSRLTEFNPRLVAKNIYDKSLEQLALEAGVGLLKAQERYESGVHYAPGDDPWSDETSFMDGCDIGDHGVG